MSLEIIENYIEISPDMDLATKTKAEISNNTVKKFAVQLRNSKVNSLDPKDGRKVVITLSADLEKPFLLSTDYILP